MASFKRCIGAALLFGSVLGADPVLTRFEIWGSGIGAVEKHFMYIGWTNGFIPGKGVRGVSLATCLETMTYDQAEAMIDKQYKDHPERWSNPLGEEILEALTVRGGPCAGKNPFAPNSK